MLKHFMNTASFLPYMDKENEQGNDKDDKNPWQQKTAQQQRDEIKVDSIDNRDDENEENKDDKSDDKSDNKGDDDKGEEEEETDDETDDDKNETEEQKKERIAAEKEARKERRIQKRIDDAIAAKKTAEAEAERLRQQLAEKPVEGLTEEEVERRAAAKAEEVNRANREQALLDEFNKSSEKIAKQAEKADKNFVKNVNEMAETVGAIPAVMIGILADLDNDNGGEVLAYLAKPDNHDEYEDLIELKNNPVKLGQKLDKLSDKVKAAKKPKSKASDLPPPIRPVDEGNRPAVTNNLTGKESMDDFVRIRARQEEEKRKRQGFR